MGTHVVSILYTSFIDKKGVTDKNTVGSHDTQYYISTNGSSSARDQENSML